MMNYDNFMFWLQGYFELSGNETINFDQLEIITNHLKLAKTVEGNKPHSFITWLDGFIEEANNCEDSELYHNRVIRIRNKLADCFKHEVDVKYEVKNTKEELNKLHNPTELFRC